MFRISNFRSRIKLSGKILREWAKGHSHVHIIQKHSQNGVGLDLGRIVTGKNMFSQMGSERIAHGVDRGGKRHSVVGSA